MHSTRRKAYCGFLSGLLFLAAGKTLAQNIEWESASTLPASPIITLDQADYQPGETAHIFATGFEPFETITLQVLHSDGVSESGEDHSAWTVAADAYGQITSSWHVCEDDCANSLLRLTAVGNT